MGGVRLLSHAWFKSAPLAVLISPLFLRIKCMQQRILQQGKAVGSEDRSTAAALVLEVRAAMYLRSAMLQLLLNSLLVHRLKRQI